MANDMKIITVAGVSKKTRDPYSSQDIDQVNGVQGQLIDDVADAGAKIIKQRTLNAAGITRVPYSNTFSTAYRY